MDKIHTIKRMAEMSAELLRDPARTGAWRGAENVARQFDRIAQLAVEVSSGSLTGVDRIAAERSRQIRHHGMTPEKDQAYDTMELATAAQCYLDHYLSGHDIDFPKYHPRWPWGKESFRPSTDRRSLEKAGALIAAELDRLERLNPKND